MAAKRAGHRLAAVCRELEAKTLTKANASVLSNSQLLNLATDPSPHALAAMATNAHAEMVRVARSGVSWGLGCTVGTELGNVTGDRVIAFTLVVSKRAQHLTDWIAVLKHAIAAIPSVHRRTVEDALHVCIADFGGNGLHTENETESSNAALHHMSFVTVINATGMQFWKTNGQRRCLESHTEQAKRRRLGLDNVFVVHADVDVPPRTTLLKEAWALQNMPVSSALVTVSDIDFALGNSPGLVIVRASAIFAAGGYREEVWKGYDCEDVDLLYRLATMVDCTLFRVRIPGLLHTPHERTSPWYKETNSKTDCRAEFGTIMRRTLPLQLVRLCGHLLHSCGSP